MHMYKLVCVCGCTKMAHKKMTLKSSPAQEQIKTEIREYAVLWIYFEVLECVRGREGGYVKKENEGQQDP